MKNISSVEIISRTHRQTLDRRDDYLALKTLKDNSLLHITTPEPSSIIEPLKYQESEKPAEVIAYIKLPTIHSGRYYYLSEHNTRILNNVSDVMALMGDHSLHIEGSLYFAGNGKNLYGKDSSYHSCFTPHIPRDGQTAFPLVFPDTSLAGTSTGKTIFELAIPQTERLIMEIGARKHDMTEKGYADKPRLGWQYVLTLPNENIQQHKDVLPLTQLSQAVSPETYLGLTNLEMCTATMDVELRDYPLKHFFKTPEGLLLIPLILIAEKKYKDKRHNGNGPFYKYNITSPETDITARTAAIETVLNILGQKVFIAPEALINSSSHCIASTFTNPTNEDNRVNIQATIASLDKTHHEFYQKLLELTPDLQISSATKQIAAIAKELNII